MIDASSGADFGAVHAGGRPLNPELRARSIPREGLLLQASQFEEPGAGIDQGRRIID